MKAETEKNKQEGQKTYHVLLWFLQTSGVFSRISLQNPRKEISKNHFSDITAFLHIYFTQLLFKHPVIHCRSVVHQHIFNYLAELGTSHARKGIAPMEHWKRVTERHGLMGRRGVYSSTISPFHSSPCQWHPLPVHRSGTAPHPRPHGAFIPHSEQGNVPVEPTWDDEIRCWVSLLGLNDTKKDTQDISSKCNCFILATVVVLAQILLDVTMFSWYILHFSQTISDFHLYLESKGKVTFHNPGLQTASKRAQRNCKHGLKPKIIYWVISLQNKLFMILYETPTPVSMKTECCIYEATLTRGSIILVSYTWTMLKIYYFVIREQLN